MSEQISWRVKAQRFGGKLSAMVVPNLGAFMGWGILTALGIWLGNDMLKGFIVPILNYLLPVLIGVGNQFGVDPAHTAITMVVCRNCATFISPVVPATFLGVGLAGVEIKDHIKSSFFWIWGVSILCLAAGLALGVLTF